MELFFHPSYLLDTFRTHDESLQHTGQRQKKKVFRCVQALRAQQTRGLPLVLFEPPCDIDGLRSLPLRLRSRRTFRDIACAQLANQVNMKQGERDHPRPFTLLDEVAAAQDRYRRMTPQDHMKLTMQVESLACVFACLSAFAIGHDAFAVFPVLGLQVQLHQPPATEIRLAGDPDVVIGIEVVVGMLVAFDTTNQALTCHSTSDPPVLAANRTACSITSVS